MSTPKSTNTAAKHSFLGKHAAAFRLGILATACVIAYGVGEILAINAYANLMPLHPGVKTVDLWLGDNREAPEIVRPRPLQLFENIPNFTPLGSQLHNSRGYRHEKDFPVKKPIGQTRILALGASTTYGYMFVSSLSETWIGQLDQMLSAHYPDRDIFGINAGLNGATTAELLSAYIFEHQYLDLDILILHVGGNDRFPTIYPDYNPQYTHYLKIAKHTDPRKGELTMLKQSGMAKLFYAWWLSDRGFAFQHGPRKQDILDADVVLDRVRNTEPVGFQRNLNTLITLAKANGTKVVLFPFIQRTQELAMAMPVEYQGLEQSFVEGLAINTKVMADIAKQRQVHFIEAPADRFDPAWFMDNCHLNGHGHHEKAKVLFEYLVDKRLVD